MRECIACIYIYISTPVLFALGGHKIALNPLQLELRTVVIHHVGAGN